MGNFIKASFLMMLLTLGLVLGGYALGGSSGFKMAVVLACFMNLGVCGFSEKIVLATHRAQLLSEEEAPEVFRIVRELSAKAGILAPRLYMLPTASANAFSTGRDPKHAAIALTHGIVGLLNEEELSGVLGHELAHILNRDMLLSSIVATLAVALSMIASMFRWSFFWGGERDERDQVNPLAWVLASILVPMGMMLIHLTIARSMEYRADLGGARLCEEPLYLASALRKIEAASKRLPFREAVPATAHLFIVHPLSGKEGASLFSTHPPVEERAARLEAMSRLV